MHAHSFTFKGDKSVHICLINFVPNLLSNRLFFFLKVPFKTNFQKFGRFFLTKLILSYSMDALHLIKVMVKAYGYKKIIKSVLTKIFFCIRLFINESKCVIVSTKILSSTIVSTLTIIRNVS